VIIGSDKRFKTTYKGKVRKPSRYLHLVERKIPFMRQAWESEIKGLEKVYWENLKPEIEKRFAKIK
jgi:hypothetical protein